MGGLGLQGAGLIPAHRSPDCTKRGKSSVAGPPPFCPPAICTSTTQQTPRLFYLVLRGRRETTNTCLTTSKASSTPLGSGLGALSAEEMASRAFSEGGAWPPALSLRTGLLLGAVKFVYSFHEPV